MSNKWSANDIGGILRKPNVCQQSSENRGEDLLVFGYACKVFRDDEKALYVDQGKHLIPWMGDKNLKIDRYDVRAALPDLSQYEPPCGGYINRLDYLSPAEQRAEQLCEEERYYSLYHNEEEEQMYQEEELKRLHQERSSSYGQVEFDYDSSTNQITTNNIEDGKIEEPDEVFTPPANFVIPQSIELPDKMKIHTIIEKTAKFISIQGPQMEILIKAKQSNNPQFEFLNQNNRLNLYYKFILKSLKNGTYPIDDDKSSENNDIDNDQTNLSSPASSSLSFFTSGSSLIPDSSNLAVVQSTFAYPTMPVPTIKYKPSANCAYTQLISKIKGVPLPSPQLNDESKSNDKHIVSDTTSYLDYTSFYGVNNSKKNHSYTTNDKNSNSNHHLIASNDREFSTNSPPTTTNNSNEPVGNFIQQTRHKQHNLDTLKKQADAEVKKISTGLMLTQCYTSDTEDESEQQQYYQQVQNDEYDDYSDYQNQHQLANGDRDNNMVHHFPIPPDYLQHVIDRTASYVAKNGKRFEDILKTKQDSRFLFLDPSSEYHPYYMYKLTGVMHSYPTSNCDILNEKLKIITPVSFSIKSKEDTAVPIKPVLPQEASDEEIDMKPNNNNNSNNNNNISKVLLATVPVTNYVNVKNNIPDNVQNITTVISATSVAVAATITTPTILTQTSKCHQYDDISQINLIDSSSSYAITNQLMSKSLSLSPTSCVAISSSSLPITSTAMANSYSISKPNIMSRSRFDVDNTGAIVNRINSLNSSTIPAKEITQQKELKRAEEKVKDRLAQIAREKLGMISKEKQLQLERRKKAMAFLDQIKSSGIAIQQAVRKEHVNIKPEHDNNDSDTSSIHSIPIDMKSDHERLTSDNDVEELIIDRRSRSRSRLNTKVSSLLHRKRKKSKHHTKKKSKKKSRSRSRSRTRSRSRSRSSRSHSHHSLSREHKSKKHSSSKKLKRQRRDY